MLKRHFTAQRINEILNHPSIYPWIQGPYTGPIDFSTVVSDKNNVCFVKEYGCALFVKIQPGIYDLHSAILPEGRGVGTMDFADEAFRWMFTKTDAFEIVTRCQYGNIGAKVAAKQAGFSLAFTTRPYWPFKGRMVTMDIYSLVIQNWVINAKNIIETGRWFHDQLHIQSELGKKIELHEDDEVHNRYVGASMEMAQNGQFTKAISFYNRWAIMSGYRTISVVSLEPLVVDLGESRILIKKDKVEVLDGSDNSGRLGS